MSKTPSKSARNEFYSEHSHRGFKERGFLANPSVNLSRSEMTSSALADEGTSKAPQRAKGSRSKAAALAPAKSGGDNRAFGLRAAFGATLFGCLFVVLGARIWQVQTLERTKWIKIAAADRVNRTEEDELPATRGSISDAKGRTLAYDQTVYDVIFDNQVLWNIEEAELGRKSANIEAERVEAEKLKNAKTPEERAIVEMAREKRLEQLKIRESRTAEEVASDVAEATERTSQNMDLLAKKLASVEGRPWKEIRKAWTPRELRVRFKNWLCGILAPALQKTPEELLQILADRPKSRPFGECILANNVNLIVLGRVKEVEEANKLGSLKFKPQQIRVNPLELDLSHILTNGVEPAYKEVLAGTPGKAVMVANPDGEVVTTDKSQVVKPINGKSLKLTLDYDLQAIMEGCMSEMGKVPGEVYVPKLDCERSVLLLLDAKTLAVRSVVCRNKDRKAGEPNWNMAFSGAWEPGSIMKVITLAGAFNTGKIFPNTEFNTYDGYYDGQEVESFKDDEPYHTLTSAGILIKSSNIGAYMLARTIGLKEWGPMLSTFGFGKRMEMGQLRGTAGIMPKEEQWNYNNMAHSAFGYNISVSPIQMCAAYGAIVNDGIFRKPYLIEEVQNDRGVVFEKHEQDAGVRIISAKAARQTRDITLQVIEEGTGSLAQSQDYWIAGKTATARYASVVTPDPKYPNRTVMRYLTGDYAVSFMGCAPADDPKLLGLVLLIKPQAEANMLYGGKLAAPVFRRCMERALKYYEVPFQEVQHVPKGSRR